MLDTVTKLQTDNSAHKRERIESELLADARRSDREIGRIVGVDHKTVGAVRRSIADRLTLPNSPPTSPSRVEALIKSLPPNIDPESQAFKESMENIERAALRESLGLDQEDDDDDFDWLREKKVVLEQKATAIYWNPDGSLVIRQYEFPDPDPVIIITPSNIPAFIDSLLEACGIEGKSNG